MGQPIRNLSAQFALIEIWVIFSCVLFSMFYPRVLVGAVGIGVLFWFGCWFANRRFSERTPTDGGVLLLLLIIPVTLGPPLFLQKPTRKCIAC
jgi:hypothetical protein